MSKAYRKIGEAGAIVRGGLAVLGFVWREIGRNARRLLIKTGLSDREKIKPYNGFRNDEAGNSENRLPIRNKQFVPALSNDISHYATAKRLVSNERLKFIRPTPFSLFVPITILIIFSIQSIVALSWATEKPLPTYKELYTEARGGRYSYDFHTWLYTAEFAATYQMPMEWINDELSGARAVAYRVEWQTGEKCGYEEGQSCRRRVKCVADIYWDKGSGLPFRNDLEVNQDSFGEDISLHWLSPQTETEYRRIDEIRRSNTLAGSVLVAYPDAQGILQFQEINTFQYERRDSEVESASFLLPCDLLNHWSSERGDLKLIIAEAGEPAQTLEQAFIHDPQAESINRVVTIPNQFYDKWRDHQDEYMGWETGYFDEYIDGPWWPAEEFIPQGYADLFTPDSKDIYDQDINIWVYTQDFADRFGLPQQWVTEEDLGDAIAIASRVEKYVSGSCYSGRCRPTESCRREIYFPGSTPIPWYLDWPVSNWGGRDRSTRFMLPIDRNEQEEFVEKTLLSQYIYGGEGLSYNRITAPIGTQSEKRNRQQGFWGLFEKWKPWRWWGGTGTKVFSHERRLDDLQVLTISTGCGSRKVWNEFKHSDTLQVRDTRILFFSRPTDSPEINRLMKKRRMQDEVAAVAGTPQDYIYRWREHQTQVFKLGREVEARVKAITGSQ